MSKQANQNHFWFFLISGTILLCIGLIMLWYLRSLIFPILIAIILAYLCRPLMKSFQYEWIPEAFRIMLILTGIFSFFLLASWQIRESIPDEDEQIELLVRLQFKVREKYEQTMDIHSGKGHFVYRMIAKDIDPAIKNLQNALYLDAEQEASFLKNYESIEKKTDREKRIYEYYLANKDWKKDQIQSAKTEKQEKREPASSFMLQPQETNSVIANFMNIISTWMIMPLVFLFLLFDKGQIKHYIVGLIPNRYFEMSLTIFDRIDEAIGSYLRGTLLQCFLVGFSLGTGFFLIGFGVKVSIVIGLFAGFANAIPFLGPFIGLVAGLSYALIAEDIEPILPFLEQKHLFFAVMIVVGIAQLMDNVFFQPVILGNAVNLHPIVVVVGVIAGSILFGFAGMLLAVPSIVVFKVLAETLLQELRAYRIIS